MLLEKNKRPCAFITGVTGQTGSFLAELLISKGYFVVGMKRRTSIISTDRVDQIYNNPNFKLVYGNMSDAASLWKLLNEYKPDEIYNLAAQSHVRVSSEVSEETLDVVGMGTLRLINAYKELIPHARFYQASSSEMYGDNLEVPQNENTKMMPSSPYACAKLFAHNIVKNYRKSYGLYMVSGILFNHESERRGETFVSRKITLGVANIKLGKQEKLFLGNLDAKRDWGYAKEYCEAIHLMLQQKNPEDFVIATNETHSVREFVEETFKLAELDWKKYIEIDERLFRPEEVSVLQGDFTKAKQKLGWEPKTKFKDLVKLMYTHDLNILKIKHRL